MSFDSICWQAYSGAHLWSYDLALRLAKDLQKLNPSALMDDDYPTDSWISIDTRRLTICINCFLPLVIHNANAKIEELNKPLVRYYEHGGVRAYDHEISYKTLENVFGLSSYFGKLIDGKACMMDIFANTATHQQPITRV